MSFLNDSRWIANHSSSIRHILKNDGSSPDGNMIANVNATKYSSPCVYFYIVSNGWSPAFTITKRHHLQAIKIVSNGFRIEVSGVTMLKMSTLTDMGAPNSHRTLWWK